MTTNIDLQDLLDIEWEGCGCSNPEKGACPACGGKPPYTRNDGIILYGHEYDCWLLEAIENLTDEIQT